MELREKIEKALKNSLFTKDEVAPAIELVAELIELQLEYDRKEYPFATSSHVKWTQALDVVRYWTEEFYNEHYKNN